jgi:hypothetical protein
MDMYCQPVLHSFSEPDVCHLLLHDTVLHVQRPGDKNKDRIILVDERYQEFPCMYSACIAEFGFPKTFIDGMYERTGTAWTSPHFFDESEVHMDTFSDILPALLNNTISAEYRSGHIHGYKRAVRQVKGFHADLCEWINKVEKFGVPEEINAKMATFPDFSPSACIHGNWVFVVSASDCSAFGTYQEKDVHLDFSAAETRAY